MFLRSIYILIFVLAMTAASAFGQQNADGTSSLFPKGAEKEDQPIGIKEQLEKMRIEREKKDHDDMIDRGNEALKISEELEKKINTTAQLDSNDRSKLESLEKLLKKIRTELGGDDDGDGTPDPDADPAEAKANERPKDVVDGFKVLRSNTIKLVDELKKTTRFTISAAAIQTTNTVLRITRFLKFWN